MKSFYQYMLRYRGARTAGDESKLAEWMFESHDFPIHSTDFDEVSSYFEWNNPFPGSLQLFDKLWQEYKRDS
ncbi:Uncharacterized protein YozE, UPF0346 family [Gracilibacillus ureilyticus]|uniref:Uncharacterized protein YozE, UPF0346 family n=1 Tax=Gracilibacillus ureilyticus TaxID=531814 RepID=A0A1H9LLL3_9BACI|nr:YozE family protein [Gracilibacillus ureilyticus]SER11773.1 Uncharacterized protein YozE, UPF0346 family [Gracilibacillus ureilyticus]